MKETTWAIQQVRAALSAYAEEQSPPAPGASSPMPDVATADQAVARSAPSDAAVDLAGDCEAGPSGQADGSQASAQQSEAVQPDEAARSLAVARQPNDDDEEWEPGGRGDDGDSSDESSDDADDQLAMIPEDADTLDPAVCSFREH